MTNKIDLKNRFKENIKKGNIEEKVGNMNLCLSSYENACFVSLENKGETYLFLFNHDTGLNYLYTQIKNKVHKKGQGYFTGYEKFTWNKAYRLIRFLEKNKRDNYL